MRKPITMVLATVVVLAALGLLTAQNVTIQTRQPVVAADGTDVAKEVTAQSLLAAMEETAANTGDDTPVPVYPEATTAGGCVPGTVQLSTAAVMEYQIKATAGQLYGLWVYSLDATPVYAKAYNDTAANTDENDTPVAVWMIPSNSTAANGSGNNLVPFPGIEFSVAITIRVVTGFAHNSTGALTANEVIVTSCYR